VQPEVFENVKSDNLIDLSMQRFMNVMNKSFAVCVRIWYNINLADRSCSKIQSYHIPYIKQSDKL